MRSRKAINSQNLIELFGSVVEVKSQPTLESYKNRNHIYWRINLGQDATGKTVRRQIGKDEGHARQVLLAAFAADLDYNKACFVVDEDVDISDMNEIIWAFVTRGRVDKRVIVIDDVPGFYRDEHKDHWGRIGIDATMPFERQAEFTRKTIPGSGAIKLDDYF